MYKKIKQYITRRIQFFGRIPLILGEGANQAENIQGKSDLPFVRSEDKFQTKDGEVSSVELRKKCETVVILHLYYPDLWGEIEGYFQNLNLDFDLFVSIPRELESFKSEIFAKYPGSYIYFPENRGRDSAPFLVIFRALYALKYKYLLKIHSKKSTYREGGDTWRRGMLDKLLGSESFVSIVKSTFDKNDRLGLIAPFGYLLNSKLYWGINKERTKSLADKIDIAIDDYPDFGFVAGSMYWAKPSALEGLIHLPLNVDDFEPEPIHIDGTLAHAVERLIGVVVAQSGFTMIEIDEDGNEISSERVIQNEFFGLQSHE